MEQPQFNLEKYEENYNYRLIQLCFQYFDTNLEKENFEENVEVFIKEFAAYKTVETKNNIKSLIEFIQDFSRYDNKVLNENLKNLSKIFINYRIKAK